MVSGLHYSCGQFSNPVEVAMSIENLQVESTLTDRYQTTVPEIVRRALRLGKRDKIQFSIRSNGEVVLSRSDRSEVDDPVLGAFLEFLARDLADHPERLEVVDQSFMDRIFSAVGDFDIDLDAPLSAEDE